MAELCDWTIPGPGGPIPVRFYRPRGASTPAPLLLFFHFGGCVIGDLDTCHTACTLIARHAGCIVLSVGYRLAPEHKFPAAVDDALAAYRWALKQAAAIGGCPDRIGVGGDSAGGYLAATISLDMRRLDGPMPKAQLLIYPVVEMGRAEMPPTAFDRAYPLSRDDMIWFASHYLSTPGDAADPRCSIGRAASLRSLPPTIVVLAGHDPLHREGLAFAGRLRADGVDVVLRSYDSLSHAFTAMSGGIPPARDAIIEVARMVDGALRR